MSTGRGRESVQWREEKIRHGKKNNERGEMRTGPK